MKTTKLAVVSCFLLTGMNAIASCEYKDSDNKRYIIPAYKAQIDYYFNGKSKNAFAQVTWGLDEIKTKACFQEARSSTPEEMKILIPTTRPERLKVQVAGGAEGELNLVPMNNGHWRGSARIPVNFDQKDLVKTAPEGSLLQITGELKIRMNALQRKNVEGLDCMKEKDQTEGVTTLFKRFEEIREKVLQRNSQSVDLEETLETFLGTCVDFIPADTDSLEAFVKVQKTTSRLKPGRIELMGTVPSDVYESIEPLSSSSARIMEY